MIDVFPSLAKKYSEKTAANHLAVRLLVITAFRRAAVNMWNRQLTTSGRS